MSGRGEAFMTPNEPRGLIGAYRKALADEKGEQAVFLADGKVTSFEDYRYRCGVIAGLRIAREHFDRCVRRFVEEEGEDT